MQLPLLPPYIHLIFETLAYFVGARLFSYLRKRDPIETPHRNWVMAGCLLGAALGAKVVVWLDHPAWFLQHWHDVQIFSSGKGIGGALAGGWLGVEITKKLIGLRRATGDLFVYPLLVAMIIGRMGCFLGGYYDQTYGMPTNLPWGVDFGDGIIRHPAQLYEILWLLALTGIIYWRSQWTHPEGYLFRLFMIGYFVFRFLIEFIKPIPHAFWGLNGTQLISLLVLACYWQTIVTLPKMLGNRRQPHECRL